MAFKERLLTLTGNFIQSSQFWLEKIANSKSFEVRYMGFLIPVKHYGVTYI